MKHLDHRLPHRTGDANAGGNRAGLGPFARALAPVVLRRASFGASDRYALTGGLRVLADDCPPAQPLDLARRGREFRGGPEDAQPILAAFVSAPHRAPTITVSLSCVGNVDGGHLRARCGDEPRTRPALVVFGPDGDAHIELTLASLPFDRVRTIAEDWTWEWCDLNSNAFQPLAGPPLAVRIYVTAGTCCNPAPRESYYHVACAAPGAADREQALQNVWRLFRDIHHRQRLTNARGRPLTFWCDHSPVVGANAYIERGARSLVNFGDSSCAGWAELLQEALAIHGIPARVMGVQPNHALLATRYRVPRISVPDHAGDLNPVTGLGLMVRPYRWAPRPQTQPLAHAEEAAIDMGDFLWKLDDPVGLCGSQWHSTDVEDLGRSTPSLDDHRQKSSGAFANHMVVLVRHAGGEHWYDPTFGLGPFNSLAAYEHELLGKGRSDCGGLFAVVDCRYLWNHDPATGQSRPVDLASLRLAAMPAPQEPVLEAVPAKTHDP